MVVSPVDDDEEGNAIMAVDSGESVTRGGTLSCKPPTSLASSADSSGGSNTLPLELRGDRPPRTDDEDDELRRSSEADPLEDPLKRLIEVLSPAEACGFASG